MLVTKNSGNRGMTTLKTDNIMTIIKVCDNDRNDADNICQTRILLLSKFTLHFRFFFKDTF